VIGAAVMIGRIAAGEIETEKHPHAVALGKTQLKPKKPRDEIIRIGSCAILLVHRETNPIRARH
jgi:hypothetical protein